jgi:hypothetical protein
MRREADEAWAREQARREQNRERMRDARGARRERTSTPSWTHARSADDTASAKRRRTCHLLFVRASHATTGEHEASACRAKAEQMRDRYGL